MNTNDLLHHVKFNRWATERLFDAAAALPPGEITREVGVSYGSLRGTLRHVYQADRIWFKRLLGEPTGPLAEFEPPDTLDAWRQDWMSHHDRFLAWAESLDQTGWDRVASYHDIKGNPYQTPVRQIILHLVNHNSFHRGQVVSLLRQAGHAPPGTDLIAYYRSVTG